PASPLCPLIRLFGSISARDHRPPPCSMQPGWQQVPPRRKRTTTPKSEPVAGSCDFSCWHCPEATGFRQGNVYTDRSDLIFSSLQHKVPDRNHEPSEQHVGRQAADDH